MADKKWSDVRFWNGDIMVNVGCSSSDHVQNTGDWNDSKDLQLNQPGCMVISGGMSNLNQTYLYKELYANGYGHLLILPSLNALNVPLYLNGLSVDAEGNPQPYVKFEGSPAVLNYYRADGTLVGLVSNLMGTGYNTVVAYCGDGLFEDGVYGRTEYHGGAPTGDMTHPYDVVGLKPHYNAGVPSKWRYEWRLQTHLGDKDSPYSPFPLINPVVVDDLYEYLPHEPEGMYDGDGQGDFDASSDAIGIPGVPTLNVLQTGFVHMYEMTTSQLQSLSGLLWDESSFYDLMIKNFVDPMEAIINLSMCPIEFTGLLTGPIVTGNVQFSTSGQVLTTPYKRIDFGTIYLNEFWGNFADYSPNTKISIFLPYAGVQNLSVDDVMNGGINLWANCDVFTGSIQYFLFSAQTNHRGHGHQSVLYTWSGNMKYNMPFAGSNFNRQIISAVANTVGTVASGVSGASTGNPGGLIGTAASSLINPMSLMGHSQVSRGGGWGGIVGALGHQYPYLILERPELNLTENYDNLVGQPNEQYDYIGNYSGGYVKVKALHLEIAGATSDEVNELESLLKDGVIV